MSESLLGTLYLIPTPLDFGCETLAPLEFVLPDATLQVASRVSYWIVENAKSTRAFLGRVAKHAPLQTALQQQHIHEMGRIVHKKGDFASTSDPTALLSPILDGHDMGLASEAGLPAVADPGSLVVRAAHRLGARIVPLIGPSALMLALMASGLYGQNFAFVGYLPTEEAARKSRIVQLEQWATKQQQTQLFIEVPWRAKVLLDSLLCTLKDSTWLNVSCNLTLPNEQIFMGTVATWREKKWQLPLKVLAVFAIGHI